MAPGEHEPPVGTIGTGAKDPLVDVAPIEPCVVRGPASPGSYPGDCPGRPSPSGDHVGALAAGGGDLIAQRGPTRREAADAEASIGLAVRTDHVERPVGFGQIHQPSAVGRPIRLSSAYNRMSCACVEVQDVDGEVANGSHTDEVKRLVGQLRPYRGERRLLLQTLTRDVLGAGSVGVVHVDLVAVGGGEEAAIGRQDTATSQPGERGEPNQTVTVAVAEVWDKPMGFYL